MFIHRPDKSATEKEIAEGKVQKNVAEILIEKHRSGPTGMVKLFFMGECTKFINLNNETGEPEYFEDGATPKAEVKISDAIDLPEKMDFSNADQPLPPPEDDGIDSEIF
jgi:hypothetical protein